MQVEEVLKRQMAALQTRFDSSMEGRQAESEMYEEAMVRSAHLEVTVKELAAKVSFLVHGHIYSFCVIC